MSLSQGSLLPQGGRAVLLSIKPKYADLILAGSKRVEFRRSWAAQNVSKIVLYSSSPIQKIVGTVEVDEVVVASPASLWRTCVEMGGGLTREELRAYFAGKSQGVAVLLGNVVNFVKHVEPLDVLGNFVPPQSFRYLHVDEYMKLERMTKKKGRR
jgi:predicted transcriptional regulator